MRVRVMWKIADGTESGIIPLGVGASWANSDYVGVACIASYDVLGGTIKAATASLQAVTSGTINQTAALSGAPDVPALGFAFGAYMDTSAAPSTLNWSGTPDPNFSKWDTIGGSNWFGGRFNSEIEAASLADRTASIAGPPAYPRCVLASGYFYFDT